MWDNTNDFTSFVGRLMSPTWLSTPGDAEIQSDALLKLFNNDLSPNTLHPGDQVFICDPNFILTDPGQCWEVNTFIKLSYFTVLNEEIPQMEEMTSARKLSH